MSREVVAATLGVSYQQLQKYESGANRISVGSLAHVARALGVTPDYFFDVFQAQEDGSLSYEDLVLVMSSSEGIQLNQAFKRIESDYVRDLVIALVDSIADRA